MAASRTGRCAQADQALRIYFVNFLKRPDWQRRPEAGC